MIVSSTMSESFDILHSDKAFYIKVSSQCTACSGNVSLGANRKVFVLMAPILVGPQWGRTSAACKKRYNPDTITIKAIRTSPITIQTFSLYDNAILSIGPCSVEQRILEPLIIIFSMER